MEATANAPDRPSGALHAKSLLVGTILGVDAIGHCIALATFTFAGPLAFALGYGTLLILFSSTIMALVLAWRSVFPGAAAMAQDTAIAILAPAMVLAAASLTGTPEEKLATAVAIMGLSTILSGLAIFCIGRFNLGRVARIMPFPVAAGFLAGSGWLLFAAGLMILTGADRLRDLPERIATAGVPPNLLFGGALVLVIFGAGRFLSGALSVLVPLLLSVGLFYLLLQTNGVSIEAARDLGLLPVLPATHLPLLPDPSLIAHVQWPVVATASVTILAVVLLNAVGFVLNTGGIEMALESDVSIDREARTTGAVNLIVGAFGGLMGSAASDSTILAHRLGCNTRSIGLALGLTTLIGCVFAGPIVAHIPVFVAAGLLLYFGAVMLIDWLVLTYARLPLLDWLTIPIILGTTMIADILVAIALGIVVALLIFVYNYALNPVIRLAVTGQVRRSPVDRAPEDEAVLAKGAGRIHVLSLQGYLFFGSVETIIEEVRHRTQGPDALSHLIIDFGHVIGLDSAACAAFRKLGMLGRTSGFDVTLSAVSPKLRSTIELWGIHDSDPDVFSYSPDLDAALEYVEDRLIDQAKPARVIDTPPPLLAERLAPHLPRAVDLVNLMERLELPPGASLIRAGSHECDVFFIESGRVDVQLSKASGPPTRLRSLRAGAVVGEAARYLNLKRTADVIVHEPSVIYRLSEAAFHQLEAEDSALAAMLHAYLARCLAEKVGKTNALLSAALG